MSDLSLMRSFVQRSFVEKGNTKEMENKYLWIWIVLVLVLPQLGWAEDDGHISNTFGIGPRAGFYKSKGAEDGAWYGGIQARLRLGSVFGLEAAADYRASEKFKVSGPGFDGTIRQHSYPVTASLLIFLPIIPHFSPYLVGGGGYYFTRTEYSSNLQALGFQDKTHSIFGWHVGGGLELPITSHIALNADVRYIFLDTKFGETGSTSLNENSRANGWVGTGALMFYF